MVFFFTSGGILVTFVGPHPLLMFLGVLNVSFKLNLFGIVSRDNAGVVVSLFPSCEAKKNSK